jgi:hypothetical protein
LISIVILNHLPMARSKRSKAAKKRFANRNEAIQPSLPPVEPPQQSMPLVQPPQPSLPPVEHPQPSLPPVKPLQLSLPPVEPPQPSSPLVEPPQSSLPPAEPLRPSTPVQSPVQGPSQSAVKRLQCFYENTSYTFTATHSPHLIQSLDTLQDNALTLAQDDVDVLIQSLPRGNMWKNNLEGFSTFEKFERGVELQKAKSASEFYIL